MFFMCFFLRRLIKRFYGRIRDKHFRNIYKNINNSKKYATYRYFNHIERLLPAFVCRLGIIPTTLMAKRAIKRGRVLVNNIAMTNMYYIVKVQDIITLSVLDKKKSANYYHVHNYFTVAEKNKVRNAQIFLLERKMPFKPRSGYWALRKPIKKNRNLKDKKKYLRILLLHNSYILRNYIFNFLNRKYFNFLKKNFSLCYIISYFLYVKLISNYIKFKVLVAHNVRQYRKKYVRKRLLELRFLRYLKGINEKKTQLKFLPSQKIRRVAMAVGPNVLQIIRQRRYLLHVEYSYKIQSFLCYKNIHPTHINMYISNQTPFSIKRKKVLVNYHMINILFSNFSHGVL